MKKTHLFLLLIFSSSISAGFCQSYPGFSAEAVKKLNTAEDTEYLDENEKEVILYINLVRNNGSLFWDSIVAPYIKENELFESRYTRSLKADLAKTKNLPPLFPELELYNCAKMHAIASGKAGVVGHDASAGSFEKRGSSLKSILENFSENCDYGSNMAVDIIINLLIDEDIPSLGHRKNILQPNIDVIGVSIQKHKTYEYTCVQDFGKLRKN